MMKKLADEEGLVNPKRASALSLLSSHLTPCMTPNWSDAAALKMHFQQTLYFYFCESRTTRFKTFFPQIRQLNKIYDQLLNGQNRG